MQLVINNLYLSFNNINILNDINISIDKPTLYGLVGANGAGKTSLLKCIIGLENQEQGRITINSMDTNKNRNKILQSVGSLIEYPVFFDNQTALENIKIHEQFMKVPIRDYNKVFEDFGLDINNKNKLSKYSLGMKQRLGIARSFSTNPDIILLDEPFNGLDPMGVKLVSDYLVREKKNKIIIVSSHAVNELIKISDKIAILKNSIIESEIDTTCIDNDKTEQIIMDFLKGNK